MIERLLIVLLLGLLMAMAYLLFKRQHIRRAGSLTAAAVASMDQPALLYFRSDDCATCNMQARFLQQLEQNWHGRMAIQTINTDIEMDKAAHYGIFTLPTTLVVDQTGEVRHINYGLADARKLARQLESIIL